MVRATALVMFTSASPAWAAEAPPIYAAASAVTTVLLLVAVLVVLLLLQRERRRQQAGMAEIAALTSARERLRAALATPADGCLLWDATGAVQEARLPDGDGARAGDTGSEGIAALLKLIAGDEQDAARTAVDALRRDDRDFELELAGSGEGRAWRLRGQALAPPNGGHVVWLTDVSAQAHRLRLAEERETTARGQLTDLQRLLDALPIPLYERSNDLAVIWCNDAYAHLVGLPKTAVPGAAAAEIETALNRNAGRGMAEMARDSGEPCSEIRHFVVDGARKALHVVELPGLRDGHLAGVVRDVTDLEEKEFELRRHMEAHAEVLNSLSTAISIYGQDKRLTYFNPAFAELWHMDSDWLGGRPLYSEVLDALRENRRLPEVPDFPAFKRERSKLFTDLLETREDIDYLPDGRILRRVSSPHPFGGLILLDEDITDSVALERSFNTLIAVQRETLDNLYEGVVVFGSDGRLKLFNPAYMRIWHLEGASLGEEPHVADVIDKARELFEDRGDWDGLKQLLISQSTSRENIDGRMERPDGSVIDYASVALPDGNMLFTYVDVTDSVNVERALRERNMALETADRLKSEFLASVSYELRTPLNVIIGFAEVLVNEYFGELNERQREYGQDILNSSQQLLALINDILDLASIEAGRLELEPSTFDVRLMLENVQMLARERAQRRKLQLRIDCPDDIDTLVADEKRIKQALFNLVSNSLKYTDPGGEIVLGAVPGDGELELFVSDNGVSIHEDDRAIVFESFQRGRRGNAEHSAGLGLSLVKRFTEMHEGRVNIESEVGQGTKISIYLPDRSMPARDEPSYLEAVQSD